MFVVSCSVLIERAFMTEVAWHSLYVSFAYKHASLICTSLSRPNAVHISGVHCNMSVIQLKPQKNYLMWQYRQHLLQHYVHNSISLDLLTILVAVWFVAVLTIDPANHTILLRSHICRQRILEYSYRIVSVHARIVRSLLLTSVITHKCVGPYSAN